MDNSIKIQGTIFYDPQANAWTSAGDGWWIDISDNNTARIAFAEPIMFDAANPITLKNYNLSISNITKNGKIEVYDVNQDGFSVKWSNYGNSSCKASFSVQGTKASFVPDDRVLSNEDSVADIYAAKLLFDYEAKYGFVSVMGSASISSKDKIKENLQILKQHHETTSNALDEEDDGLSKKALQKKLDMTEKRVDRQKTIVRKCNKYWESAKEFGRLWGEYAANEQEKLFDGCYVPICTGGGPGIMQAVAEGARSENAHVIGIDCQFGNDNFFNLKDSYSTYSNMRLRMNNFSIREGILLNYSHVILFWPGGYGTMWEVCETLSKISTKHLRKHKVKAIFVHSDYWKPFFALVEHMREYGTINSYGDRIKIPGVDDKLPDDAYIAEVVDTAREAFNKARGFVEELYDRNGLTLRGV